MADANSSHPRAFRGLDLAGRLSILGAIATFFVIFVGSVLFGFSGYVLRVTLDRDLAAADASLDELFFTINHEKDLVIQYEASIEEAQARAADAAAASAAVRSIDAEYWLKDAERLAAFRPVSLHFSRNGERFDPQYISKFQQTLFQTDDFERAKKLTALIASPVFLPDVDPARLDESVEFLAEQIMKIGELNEHFEKITAASEAANAEANQLTEQLNAANASRDEARERLETLRASNIFANRSRVLSLEPLFAGAFYGLVQVPTIILTLIVTIAAGGLGSVVAFTRNLLKSVAPGSARMLFVSVGEGVAAAVAIFFLAGAGMLMFSTGGSNGGAELSPYMVAFLAFVSGFMADDAFDSIQRTGRNLFKGSEAEEP